jgi:hypothetical protein
MPRSYPNGRRRRPGRRPPDRYLGGQGRSQSQGFTPPGLRSFYDVCMPALKGREKRAFFNRVSGGMVLGSALGAAMIGYSWLGPVGAIFGLGAGIAAGGSIADKGRFYRR